MSEDPQAIERDFADTLKIEASGLSPKKETQVKKYIGVVKESIEKQFGQYFSPETSDKIKGIEDRVIAFADKEGFSEYVRGMFGQPDRQVNYIVGLHTKAARGDLSVIQPVGGYSTKGEEELETLAKSWKVSKEQARRDVQLTEFKNTLVHEILHGYQDETLSHFFAECAVPYYVDKVMRDVKDSAIRFYRWDERIAKYNDLIKKYGDGVHRLFFGSNKNPLLKAKVYGEFGPATLKMLFPKRIHRR
jgi:hypothetical protein